MSETNSQNNEEKTEQNLERPDDLTEGDVAQVSDDSRLQESPSEEENQSSETQLDEAMREKESMASATLVPPPDHGWLEQFEAFGVKAFGELERVALLGLTEVESEFLIQLSVKLIRLARNLDPQALNKFLDSVDDLN